MLMRWNLGVGDPEVQVIEVDGDIHVLMDPRLSIIQIRQSVLLLMTPEQLTHFHGHPRSHLDCAITPDLLSLVS